MAYYTRSVGTDVSVFTLGGEDFLGYVSNATITVDIKVSDAGAVRDGWNMDLPVGASWTIDADNFIETANPHAAEAASGDRLVSVSITTGAGAYSGDGVLKSFSHTLPHQDLQTVKVQIVGHGALTFTPVS